METSNMLLMLLIQTFVLRAELQIQLFKTINLIAPSIEKIIRTIISKKMILLTDWFNEERPIIGRGGTQNSFANIQLRLPRRGLSETFQKTRTVCSTDDRVEYLEQHQLGEQRIQKKHFSILILIRVFIVS